MTAAQGYLTLFFLASLLLVKELSAAVAESPAAPFSGYVWAVSSQELVPLQANVQTAKAMAERQRPVRLDVFRGEVEAFQVVLTPHSSSLVRGIRIEVKPPIHTQDSKVAIPRKNVQWFRVGYVNYERADILMPVQKFDTVLGEHYNYPMWVRVRVPRNAKPGLYVGQVAVLTDSGSAGSIPLKVKVWRTSIPMQAHFNTAEFGFWEHHIAAQMGIQVGSQEMRNLLTQGARMLAEHRIVHDNDGIGPVPYRLQYDPLSTEGEKEIIRWCEFWTKRGLRLSCSFRVLGMNPSQEQKEYARRFWAVYAPILRKRGWDKMVYTKISDEWHGDAGARGCVEAGLYLKSLMPTLQIAATSIGTDEPLDPDKWLNHFKVASQVVTIWGQTAWNHMGPYRWEHPYKGKNEKIRQFLIERAAAGDKVWLYIHDSLMMRPEDDLYKIRSFFWQLSAYGFDGCWLWGTTAWGDQPENRLVPNPVGLSQTKPYGPALGDGVLFWPGEKRLLESVRLELVRDGIEDWECFRLLNERLKRAKRDGNKYAQWMSKAEQAFQLRAGQVNYYVPPQGGFEHKTDPNYFAKARKALCEALDGYPADRHE